MLSAPQRFAWSWALACTSLTALAAVGGCGAKARDPAGADSPPTTLVAELRTHGTQVCTDEMRTTWTDLYPIAGFVPVVAPPALTAGHVGSLVVIRGHVPTTPTRRYVSYQPCEPMQLRSDWVSCPEGTRIAHRELAPDIPAIEASAVTRWRGLTVTRRGDTVDVTLENRDIGAELREVRVAAHFEGCMRKPGTDRREAPAFDLPVGASKTLSLPLFTALEPDEPARGLRDRQKAFRLASLLITNGGGGATLLIERELASEGIPFSCE